MVGGLSDDEALPVVIDGRSLAETEVSTRRTDAGEVDVLSTTRGERGERRTFSDLVDRSNETVVTGATVRIACLRDIVWAPRGCPIAGQAQSSCSSRRSASGRASWSLSRPANRFESDTCGDDEG